MAHYTGADMVFELDAVNMPGVREVVVPEEHPAPDTTHAADDHGTSIPGGITYHNGCTATFVDDDGGVAWDALEAGTEGTLTFYPEGKVSSHPLITADIVVTNRPRSVAYNDVVVFTITFNMTSYAESTYTP